MSLTKNLRSLTSVGPRAVVTWDKVVFSGVASVILFTLYWYGQSNQELFVFDAVLDRNYELPEKGNERLSSFVATS